MDNTAAKKLISISRDDNIGWIILDRMEKRNAINGDLLLQLEDAVVTLDNDDAIDILVITSSEKSDPPVFSSGIDLMELGMVAKTIEPSKFPGFIKKLQDSITSIEKASKPVIAAINGICYGSAYEIALACDFRIGTTDTEIGMFETSFGIIPDLGGTSRLVHTVGMSRAKRVIMLGEKISSDEALELGLLDWLVEPEKLNAKVEYIVEKLSRNSQSAVRKAKRLIHNLAGKSIEEGLELEIMSQVELFASGEVEKRINEYLRNKGNIK